MNLYKIEFSHTAPKDREFGVKCLLLAPDDESVYNWIASEPEIGEDRLLCSWYDFQDYVFSEDYGGFVDEDGDPTGCYWEGRNGEPQPFKDLCIERKGEMNYEGYDYTDAYYGITLYGWSLISEDVDVGSFAMFGDSGFIQSVNNPNT